MDKTTADFEENAPMSRNWKSVEFSDREGETLLHDEPPLVVSRTVLFVPDTQTTSREMGDSPRNCWVLFVGVMFQVKGLCVG